MSTARERRDRGEGNSVARVVELNTWPDRRLEKIESEVDIKQTSELKFDIKGRTEEADAGLAETGESDENNRRGIIVERSDRGRKIGEGFRKRKLSLQVFMCQI